MTSATRATGPLPPDVEAQVRAYLAAFLPPEVVDGAVHEVAADSGYWGDTESTDVLAVAHAVLASRLRVATDVEALVLDEDVGLSVPEISAVLALPPAETRRILDEALAVVADLDDEPAPPEGAVSGSVWEPSSSPPSARPTRGWRPRLPIAAAIGLAAVAVIAACAIGWG